MDSGMLTMEGAVSPHQESRIDTGLDHTQTSKSKGLGTLPLKQERSAGSADEAWRKSKIFKPNSFDDEAASFLLRSGSMVSGDDGQTMLCFSSSTCSKHEEALLLGRVAGDASTRNQEFPFFQTQQSPYYAKGSASGRCHEGVYGPFSRYRGPFTPSQWMELEHQALIYKHLMANVPVPSNLLIPLKKSLNPYAYSSFSSGSYVSNSLGWGPFHLGFSSNTDPEPGRCRRTDGKKWRCSRDAVPDQKYCERHINRGRHRSRKPVEGQTGHAVSGSTSSKVAPIASSSASVISSGGASNSLGAMQHQFKNSLPSAANPSTDLFNRLQNPQGLPIISPTISLKSRDSPMSIQRQQMSFDESSQQTFGLVSSDSLLNPSQKSALLNSGNSNSLLSFSDQETQDQHPVRHFIDNLRKDESDQVSVAWPGELKSDWTQLSMSIPMTSTDFSSSSNSPQQKRLTLSPLRLAGEFDPIQMGLSVTNDSTESQKQSHWLPVSWGNSMGGPLGEVLNRTSNTAGGGKSSSALNLVSEGWDTSPQLGSSPTGVLQKSSFVSLSNSSAGSSPRGDNNKAPEAVSFCNDLLGSNLASSSRIPSM